MTKLEKEIHQYEYRKTAMRGLTTGALLESRRNVMAYVHNSKLQLMQLEEFSEEWKKITHFRNFMLDSLIIKEEVLTERGAYQLQQLIL